MTISVFNICSNWLEGLEFSSKIACENAQEDLHYFLILWNPSKEVLDWVKENDIDYFLYNTDESLTKIQNLRQCFNMGFNKGFEFNEWTCGINTDILCHKGWLKYLSKYKDKKSIINCRQIEPHNSIHEIKDFGVPDKGFNMDDFFIYCSTIFEDKLVDQNIWGRRADATPHLIHKSLWESVGEWEVKRDNPPADVSWFNKAQSMGFKNMKSLGSICYHFGAVETNKNLR